MVNTLLKAFIYQNIIVETYHHVALLKTEFMVLVVISIVKQVRDLSTAAQLIGSFAILVDIEGLICPLDRTQLQAMIVVFEMEKNALWEMKL